MQLAPLCVFSFLMLLSGPGSAHAVEDNALVPGQSRWELTVQVRPSEGMKLPHNTWITVEGLSSGYYSTLVLSGQRTLRFPALRPGRYRVRVEAEGHRPSQAEVQVKADEYLILNLGPAESKRPPQGQAVVDYRLLQLSPKARTHWDKAGRALAENRFHSALENLEEVIRTEPNFPEAHSSTGLVALKLGQHDRAHRAFQKAAALDPADYRHHLGLGWFYLSSGRPSQGLEPLQKAVELKPADPEALAFLGEALRLTGNPEQGRILLKKALSIHPKLGFALHFLGLAYVDLDQPEQALQCFRRLRETGTAPELLNLNQRISELEQRPEKK